MSGSLLTVQAQTAASFDASIGINVHPPYPGTSYANQSLWLAKLEAAGFEHVRTNWDENQPTMDAQVEALASAGIKVLITSDALYSEGESPQSFVSYLVAHPQLAASIYQIAGPNEINASFSNWQTGVVPFMEALYNAIKGNSVTAHIQIVAPNFNNMQYDQSLATQLGSISQYVDEGDIHGTNGGDADNDAYFAEVKQTATTLSGSKPLINTEGGYSSGTDSSGHDIPLPADAVQVDALRYYFDDFAAGIQSSDLYQMMRSTPGDTVWGDDFYILNDDGTPTPVYNEIKATTALLHDSGTPLATTGSLTYGLTGADSSTKTILLEKSDGSFWLAYWEDKQYYEYSVADADKGYTNVAPTKLTLQLGSAASGALFNPYSGSSAPVSSFSNVTSISLSATTVPQLIEIVPVTATVAPGPVAHSGTLTVGHGQTANLTSIIDGLVTPGSPGDTETITGVSAAKGKANLGSNDTISYVAPASGTDTITYTATDQHGDTATGTVAVTVDSGPEITPTTPVKIGHGQTVQIAAVAVGLPGDTLSLIITSAGRGTVSLSGSAVRYTAPGGGGTDNVGYAITDEYGDSASGTMALAVDPGPIAAKGNLTVGHSDTANLTSFVDGLVTAGLAGDTETITAISAAKGQASLGSTGVITYVAPASGGDAISYTATDQLGDVSTGSIAVTVDSGPSAGTLTTTVNLGGSVNLTSAILGVVTAGLKGDTLTLTADGTQGTLGTVSMVAGQLTYSASGSALQNIPANGKIADSFTYTVSDQYGDTATGTVDLSVTNQNTVINGPQNGGGTIQAAATGNSTVNAFGSNNVIYDNGGNDVVNAGQGHATVYVNTGSVDVNLGGSGNVVTGFNKSGAAAVSGSNGNVSVSGSQGSTTVNLGNGQDTISLGGTNNTVSLENGNNLISAGQGSASVNLGGGNNQVTVGGYLNEVVAGNGNDKISGSQGLTSVTLGNGTDAVTLGGYGNVIQVGNGQDTITAGAGVDQVTAGNGSGAITLQGGGNTVVLGSGVDKVDAGSSDNITVNGTNLQLMGGTQETVFLGAGSAAVDDLSSMTTVIASTTSGSANILDFAKDQNFVLELKGSVGAYTTTAGVVSALKSDGHGGTELQLGSGTGAPLIDFLNTSSSLLTSTHFKIG